MLWVRGGQPGTTCYVSCVPCPVSHPLSLLPDLLHVPQHSGSAPGVMAFWSNRAEEGVGV